MNYTREELFKHSGELLELIEDIVRQGLTKRENIYSN